MTCGREIGDADFVFVHDPDLGRSPQERRIKNVPQTGRPGFDDFLELERGVCDFVGVNRAA
jgi:hypothetical protein